MLKIVYLEGLVKEVCPHIDGISIGRWNNKSSWRIDYKPEATEEEKKLAMKVFEDFDADAPVPEESKEKKFDAMLTVYGLTKEDLKTLLAE